MARVNEKRNRGDGAMGERVRKRRKTLGLTAKELAHAAQVSASYVSQLERGKQDRPSLDVLGALAAALGTSTSELLGEPLSVVTTPSMPPALAALAEELGLDEPTVTMLAGINIAGRRPATRDGWLLILLAIRQACAGSADIDLPSAASG